MVTFALFLPRPPSVILRFALEPLKRALVRPLTLSVAETTRVPAGALRRNVSLPFLTHVVALGRPRTSSSDGAGVVGVGTVAGASCAGPVGAEVGVGVGVGVDDATAEAC